MLAGFQACYAAPVVSVSHAHLKDGHDPYMARLQVSHTLSHTSRAHTLARQPSGHVTVWKRLRPIGGVGPETIHSAFLFRQRMFTLRSKLSLISSPTAYQT